MGLKICVFSVTQRRRPMNGHWRGGLEQLGQTPIFGKESHVES